MNEDPHDRATIFNSVQRMPPTPLLSSVQKKLDRTETVSPEHIHFDESEPIPTYTEVSPRRCIYPASYYAPGTQSWRKVFTDGSIMVLHRLWGQRDWTIYVNRNDYITGQVHTTTRHGCQVWRDSRSPQPDLTQSADGSIVETIKTEDGQSVSRWYPNVDAYERFC